MAPDPLGLALVLAWGVLAGLDLVSWPQMMLSRPVVAGGVAGALLGDPVAGVTVGALLELYALEVVPIGATRYPDFSPGAVAGATVMAGGEGLGSLGLAAGVGLVVAQASRPLLDLVRRRNAAAAQAAAARLAAGDTGVIGRLQLGGLLRDAARALLLTAAGLAAALAVRHAGPPPPTLGAALLVVAVAGGAAAALAGAVRTVSQGGRLAWLAAGGVVGVLILVWR
jgi:PTS system mannose-specific IIC component